MESIKTPSRGESANNGGSVSPTAPLKLNMIDRSITVQTATFVDLPQQDSGSNQSGSDSGLGYTNSISSDNSILNTPASQDQLPTGATTRAKKCNINNTDEIISIIKASDDGLSNAAAKTNHPTASTSIVGTSFAASMTPSSSFNKISVDNSPAFSSTKSKSDLERTRTKPDEMLTKQSASSIKHIHHTNHTNDKDVKDTTDAIIRSSGRGCNSSCDDGVGHTNYELASPKTKPITKSLLKKPSFSTAGPKHNRNVSFNQTVIVFCEEIGTTSPVEQFEPPLGYQDVVGAFEPPEDYCDHRRERNSDNVSDNSKSPSSQANGGNFNLTDDQLLGLLEKESLLNPFRLSCDDSSDEDFPINHLNSDQSYLCNDAISDYDSDSESSVCVENRLKAKPPQKIANSQEGQIKAKISLKTNQSHDRVKSEQPDLDSQAKTVLHENDHDLKPHVSKSMPARMKVTTLDQNQLRKQVNRDEEEIYSSKHGSCHEFHHLKGQNHGSRQEFSSDTVKAVPVVIKQSNINPLALSKPTAVHLEAGGNSLDSVTWSNHEHKGTTTHPMPKPNDSAWNNNINRIEKVSSQQNESNFKPISISNYGQQSCQVCKVIGSSRVKSSQEPRNQVQSSIVPKTLQTPTQQSNTVVQSSQSQSVKLLSNQPPVYSQSCVSCREASSLQNGLPVPLMTNGPIQPTRPVAYQLVYVVDQQGNRMRALSMVRPDQLRQAMSDRRIFVAQNNVRFPNPVSVTGIGQIVTIPNNKVNLVQNDQGLLSNNEQQANTQHYPQTQQRYHLPNINIRPNTATTPVNNIGVRSHMVYYVRQPLDAHSIIQLTDPTGSNIKSFPDAHEIRRLDGLRAPTATINRSGRLDDVESHNNLNHNSEVRNQFQLSSETARRTSTETVSKDDVEDPTFGFSRRPAVKVVSAGSNLPSRSSTLNNRSKSGNFNFGTLK